MRWLFFGLDFVWFSILDLCIYIYLHRFLQLEPVRELSYLLLGHMSDSIARYHLGSNSMARVPAGLWSDDLRVPLASARQFADHDH